MVTKSTKWIVLFYGALLLIAGWMGYVKGGSKISLYMGSISGALVVLSACALFAKYRKAIWAALTFTALLTFVFVIRYARSGSPPAALLSLISGCMLTYLLICVPRWKRKQ